MPRKKQDATDELPLPVKRKRPASSVVSEDDDVVQPSKTPVRRRRKQRPKKQKQREEARRAMDQETKHLNKVLSKRYKLVRLSAKEAGYSGPYVKLEPPGDGIDASLSPPADIFIDGLLEHIVENQLDPALKSKKSIRTITKLKVQQRGRAHCLPKSSVVKQVLERSNTENTAENVAGVGSEFSKEGDQPRCAFCQCERGTATASVQITGALLGPYLLQNHQLSQITTSSAPYCPTSRLPNASDAEIIGALTDEILASGEPKDVFLGEAVYFHDHCLRYCDSVYMIGYRIPQLHSLLKFARRTRCSHCDRLGANLVCFRRGSHNRNRKCSKSYHYACAMRSKCYFDIATYQLACDLHVEDLRLLIGHNPLAIAPAKTGGKIIVHADASDDALIGTASDEDEEMNRSSTSGRRNFQTDTANMQQIIVPSACAAEKFAFDNLEFY